MRRCANASGERGGQRGVRVQLLAVLSGFDAMRGDDASSRSARASVDSNAVRSAVEESRRRSSEHGWPGGGDEPSRAAAAAARSRIADLEASNAVRGAATAVGAPAPDARAQELRREAAAARRAAARATAAKKPLVIGETGEASAASASAAEEPEPPEEEVGENDSDDSDYAPRRAAARRRGGGGGAGKRPRRAPVQAAAVEPRGDFEGGLDSSRTTEGAIEAVAALIASQGTVAEESGAEGSDDELLVPLVKRQRAAAPNRGCRCKGACGGRCGCRRAGACCGGVCGCGEGACGNRGADLAAHVADGEVTVSSESAVAADAECGSVPTGDAGCAAGAPGPSAAAGAENVAGGGAKRRALGPPMRALGVRDANAAL